MFLLVAYTTIGTNSGIQTVPNPSLGETYVTLGPCKMSEPPAHVQLNRQESMSKE